MADSVLITGGAGFIGSHLAERFLREGHAVTVLDDLSTGTREHVPSAATLEVLDVASEEARRLIREGGFSLICHLAAQMDVRHSVADPLHDGRTNVLGTISVARGALAAPRPPRVVFASTGGALYGDANEPPHREDVFPEPDSPYGAAKLACESYLSYFARIQGLPVLSLRIGNVYGPRQDPHGEAGVVAIFIGRLLAGEPLTIFGDGTQTRDYVAVDDICDAFVRAGRAPIPAARTMHARACNLGSGRGTSIIELAAALGRIAGIEPRMQFAARRTGEQQQSFLDVKKAERLLGWRAHTTLDEGLRMTFDWFAARPAQKAGA